MAQLRLLSISALSAADAMASSDRPSLIEAKAGRNKMLSIYEAFKSALAEQIEDDNAKEGPAK